MKLKTIHELDFASQRAIVGGAAFGDCTCTGECVCKCADDSPSKSTENEGNESQSLRKMSQTQLNNL